MKSLSPRDVAEKQIRKAQAATEDYIKGVRSVKEPPGMKAVKKKDKLKSNFVKAVDSGKWEEGTAAVTLDEWQRKAAGKGAERFGPGVADSAAKIEAFHDEFIPFLQSHTATLDSMPDATWEQRKQKMVANAEGIQKFRRTRRRR